MPFRNSFLNKYTGLENPPSEGGKIRPQIRAAKIFGKSGASQWGRASGLACVDDGLSDKAFRLLSLIAIKCAGQTRFVELGKPDITFALDCHRDTARVLIAELEASKYVKVHRKHNNRNVFELCVDLFATKEEKAEMEEPEEVAPGKLQQCSTCGKYRAQFTEHGWCFPCATKKGNKAKMLRVLRECGENLPEYPVAMVMVKAEQNRGMKRAYLEAVEELAR